MSSTEDPRTRDDLLSFYRERLATAARDLKARGIDFFPSAFEPDAASWYVDRRGRQDPELVELDPKDHSARLRDLWTHQGLPELVSLAEALMQLAVRMSKSEDGGDDVSPFIYVMF